VLAYRSDGQMERRQGSRAFARAFRRRSPPHQRPQSVGRSRAEVWRGGVVSLDLAAGERVRISRAGRTTVRLM
jgi:hypothetical protein